MAIFSVDNKPSDKSEIDDSEWDDIKVVGNEVFFYTDVSDESIVYLFKVLRQLEQELLYKMYELPGYKPEIKLYIKSDGGDMFAGFSAHDQLSQMRVRVTTIADGCCASAATFMLLGGHKKLIKPHSHVLIHSLATDGFWGKFSDMKTEMDNCKKFMDMIKNLYEEKCDIPEKKFKKMMDKDIYINPDDCVKWGVVDEIMKSVKISY